MKIGFIGLGNMGLPMAMNLSKANYDVVGFDIISATDSSIRRADHLIEAVLDKDVVITMLPDGKILNQVYKKIAVACKKNTIVVDCSTVDVKSAVEAAQLARNYNLQPVDAPVSGGVVGAEAGTLTFMVGGAPITFQKIRCLFDVMGKKSVLCGKNGSGQAAKICNNVILGVSMIGVCEAFSLADKLGLDKQKMFEVVSTSSGQCWSLNTYCPVPGVGPKSPADNNYEPGFASELMHKDLKLAQSEADLHKVYSPLGEKALSVYSDLLMKGGKGKDFSAVINLIKNYG